jgi:hypothetical protein
MGYVSKKNCSWRVSKAIRIKKTYDMMKINENLIALFLSKPKRTEKVTSCEIKIMKKPAMIIS